MSEFVQYFNESNNCWVKQSLKHGRICGNSPTPFEDVPLKEDAVNPADRDEPPADQQFEKYQELEVETDPAENETMDTEESAETGGTFFAWD